MKQVYKNTGSSTERYWIYSEVGKNQVYLTEAEEIFLTKEYQSVRYQLHKYILSKPQCRQWFMETYRETREAGRSVAKLSAAFNPREEGLNEKLEKEMVDALSRVRTVYPLTLINLELSDYCFKQMVALIPQTKKLTVFQDELLRIEDKLLRSMLMAAHDIAYRSASNILSIDAVDAAQEVCIYMLESIRKYDPDYRTAQGKRVKLCTYAYGRSEKLIQEWILTNSRLVRVPRSKMERVLIVVKAYDSIVKHDLDILSIMNKANEILTARKGMLTQANTFTIDEVDKLVRILTSSYVHLDQPYNKHHKGTPTTIGEMISNDDPYVDTIIEKKDNKEKLLSKIEECLSDLEYQVITLRYFYDPTDKIPKALTDVSTLLVSVYGGKDYSRESIRQIEKAALEKLKQIEEVQDLW